MYEYRIINRINEQENIIFGRSYVDACRRAKLNPAEYTVMDCEYVD